MRRFRIISAFLAVVFVLGMTGCEALRKQPSDSDGYWFDFGGNKNRGDSSYGYGYHGDPHYSGGSTGGLGKPDNTSEPEIIEDPDYAIIRGVKYPIATTTELSLLYNSINDRDVAEIAKLKNLTKLELGDNNINDISPLASLTKLTELAINNNRIRDISPLSSLTDLTMLSISRNYITDISPLASLTNLTELYMSYNHISNLSVLENFPKLERLIANNNQISDITPIGTLSKLKILYIDENPLTAEDIRELQKQLPGCRIDGFYPEPTVPQLPADETADEKITVHGKELSVLNTVDVTFYFQDLTDEELAELGRLKKLKRMNLRHNKISDLTPLKDLRGLTYLYLSFNQISDISPLASLTALTELEMSGNKISDLTPLAGLIYLEKLDLSANMITDIEPLMGLTNLKSLDIYGNPRIPKEDIERLRKALPDCEIR